jgi:SAM-dependent methyltransferase
VFPPDSFRTLLDRTDYLTRNGIPRFTPDSSYSTGNFAKLRERHASLQLDSRNGTTDRYDTFLQRTKWPVDFLRGKLVLECGCGAGPDTEILLRLGARVVAVDIAGLDIAAANIGENPNVQFVQASITDLPFRREQFDVVFCHRVLQHTPNPEHTLDHILGFVRPDGHAFVHSYARTWQQMLRWKYAFRPFTKRLDPERLYAGISAYAEAAFKLTNAVRKLPGGRYFNHVVVPFLNYRHVPQFQELDDQQVVEYGIHDTFDALSPPYDSPLSAAKMRAIAAKHLTRPFIVDELPAITLLRTLP